jgi:hypothetical protein
MIRKLILSVWGILAIATAAQAGLNYRWVQTGTGLYTNDLVLNGSYDTWEFQLQSLDLPGQFGGAAKNYDALSLNFTSSSGAFLGTGGTTFKSGSANPTVFGFTAPDCFFVLPTGATQLAATQTDTANILQSDFTTQGGVTLVPISGVPTTVAAFSVPTGTTLSAAGIFFVGGSGAASGSDFDRINTFLPEPSALALFSLALATSWSFSRHRYPMQ